MQALKLNEVLLRVVAWHNRHPLARRIGPSQVHSIGEVLLPFASAQPLGGALAPVPAQLARWAPRPLPGGAAARPAPTADPGGLAHTDTINDAPPPHNQALPGPDVHSLLRDDAAASDAAATAFDVQPEPEPGSEGCADTAALPGPVDAQPAPAAGHVAPTIAHAPDAGRGHAPAVVSWAEPPAARAGRPRLLLAKLRSALTGRRPGLPPLKPAFSRDFIWPLTPRQVARWAQRHGETQALAPVDWPRREVDSDPVRLADLRRQGLTHSLPLHVLTAAIGVGDRRIRVLMDAHGAIIGPRAYSRPRQASAAAVMAAVVMAALVLATGWGLRPAPAHGDADAAVLAALAASAVEASASAAETVTAAGTASAAAAAAGAATLAAAPASALAAASSTDSDTLPAAAATTAAAPTAEASSPAASGPAASSHAPPAAKPMAQVAQVSQTAAEPAPPTEPAAPLGRIRPALSDDQKQAARQQAAQLRAAAPPAPVATPANPTAPAPVYAVVTRPNPLREAAASSLALMRATRQRLPPSAPPHGELMQNQGQWRAAWWPFASLAEAERARVMLAGRGLKTEVIEF